MELPDLKDGVFVGIRNKKNPDEILFVKHKYGERKWGLPGGGVRLGEIIPYAAIREALEETRVNVTKLHQIGLFTLRKKYGLVVLFLAVEWEGTPSTEASNPEIEEVKFMSVMDIPESAIYPAQLALAYLVTGQKYYGTPVYGHLTNPPNIIIV